MSDIVIADDRAYAATLARRYFYDRSVTIDTVVETFQTTTDPLIAEMIELITHEPERAGMLGARNDQYLKHYWPHVAAVLRELERGEAGQLPAQGRFTLGKLAVIGVITALCAASVLEHIGKIVPHLAGTARLAWWEFTLHTAGALFMFFVTLGAAAGFTQSLRQYRHQRERRGRDTLPPPRQQSIDEE